VLKFEFKEFVAGIQDYIYCELFTGDKQGGGAASTPRPWGKVTSAFPWGRKQGEGSRQNSPDPGSCPCAHPGR
jgi:hypothetical protein